MVSVARHPNWEFALQILAAVLPGSTEFNHDKIVGIPRDGWFPFDIEQRDQEVIEDDFLSRCVDLIGPLVVVNNTSFDPDQGPYFVDAARFHNFVKTFDVQVKDYFMYASVFVVSPVMGKVIIVQDDGFMVSVQGRPLINVIRSL